MCKLQELMANQSTQITSLLEQVIGFNKQDTIWQQTIEGVPHLRVKMKTKPRIVLIHFHVITRVCQILHIWYHVTVTGRSPNGSRTVTDASTDRQSHSHMIMGRAFPPSASHKITRCAADDAHILGWHAWRSGNDGQRCQGQFRMQDDGLIICPSPFQQQHSVVNQTP